MTGVIKVDTIQRNDGTNHTIDTLGLSDGYRNNAGQIVARPQFMASGQWGAYTMAFTSVDQTSFTNISSGRTTFPAMNVVYGANTTGFTASTTPGNCKYRIPLTGTYMMSFRVLVNTDVSNHLDSAFLVTNSSDTFIVAPTWVSQYLGNSAADTGPCGFSRLQETDAITSAVGVDIIARFFEGQYIRPMIAMNATVSASIHCSDHNYWHATYLGK
jgi:hypothetical protein